MMVILSKTYLIVIVIVKKRMLLINELYEYDSKLFAEYKSNLDWIALNYQDLLLLYENKYVAVKDKNVIDSDAELQTLLKRIESDQAFVWKTMTVLFINRDRRGFNS